MRPLAACGVAAALVVTGCGGDPQSRHAVIRLDSAGMSIVTAPGPDRPLEWSWTPRLRLGGRDVGPEAFYRVSRALTAVDTSGRIFVLDPVAFRVTGFDRDGTPLWSAGARGGGPGELLQPWSVIATGDGGVAVLDRGKNAMVMFDASGAPTAQVPLAQPAAIGRTGPVWLLETWNHLADRFVIRLDRVARGDTVEVTRTPGARISRATFTVCGPSPPRIGPVVLSPALPWHAGLTGFAASPGTAYEVGVYDHGARLTRLVRRPGFARAATRQDALDWAVAHPLRFLRDGAECLIPAAAVVDQTGYADSVPAIADLALAPDGGLWVRRWTPAGEGGPIDVFDRSGEYLGTLPGEFPFPLHFLPTGEPLFVERDANDVERLVVATLAR